MTLISDNYMLKVRGALYKLSIAGSVALAFGIIFLMVPSSLEAEEAVSMGLIQGKVTNKTLDNKDETGLEVILYLHAGSTGQELARTNSGADGSFSFKNQDMAKKRPYYVSADYKGVEYFSRVGAFGDSMTAHGDKSLVLDLNVAETTDKDDDIAVSSHRMLMAMDQDKGILLIKELMVVQNRGLHTYVGNSEVAPGKKETLHISLPEGVSGFQNLQGVRNSDIAPTGNGAVDTVPIKPGIKRILFSYSVDTKGKDFKFLKVFNLETKQFEILFPEAGVQMASDQLTLQGPMESNGQNFYTLSGQDFPAGSQITVDLKGGEKGNIVKWGVVLLGVIILGAGIGLPLMRRKNVTQGDEAPEKETGTEAETEIETTDVLRAIAELDDQAEAGEIDPEDYKTQRAELLSRTSELSE